MARQEGERCERRRWRKQRAERVAAVDKIEGKRKPEDFIGHRNRTRPLQSVDAQHFWFRWHARRDSLEREPLGRALAGNSPPDCFI